MDRLKSNISNSSSALFICHSQSEDVENGNKKIANGHEVSKHFARFICIEKVFGLCLIIQLFICIIYYESDYPNFGQKGINYCLYLLIAVLVFSVMFCILAHKSYNDLKVAELRPLESGGIYDLIIKIFLILIQPYIFLENLTVQNWNYKTSMYEDFALNYLLVLFSLFKVTLIVPCLMNTLKFKKPRSARVCKIYGCSNSYLYEIKCYFKECPAKLITIMFIGSIVIFSVGYRISERNPIHPNNHYQNFSNCLWLVVTTMTTVGFGDIVPYTTFGRVVGVICTIWGVLVISILIVVVTNTFEMDGNENKSLRILKKLEQKKEVKRKAAQYIGYSLARLWRNRKMSKGNVHNFSRSEDFRERNLKNQFKEALRLSKFNETSDIDLGEEMSRQFQRAEHHLESLILNFDSILNHLSTEYFLNIEQIKDETKFNFFASQS